MTVPVVSLIDGTLVGRTPLLPLDTVAKIWGDDPTTAVAKLIANPVVSAALTYASPSLAADLPAALEGDGRAARAVVSYLTRMSVRTTPFGLFAGVGAVREGDTTTLTVAEEQRRTISQWDFGFLDALIGAARDDLFDAGQLRFVFNGSTIVKGDRLALVPDDRELAKPDAPRLQSSRLSKTLAYLRTWLSAPQSVDAIAGELARRFGHDDSRSRAYLRTIWKAGFLIAQDAVSPNGDVALAHAQLAAAHPTAGLWVGAVQQRIACVDAQPLGETHTREYRAIVDEARAHSDAKSVLRVDLSSPFLGELNRVILREARTLAELALRSGRPLGMPAITQRFTRCFEGSMRFVPLLEAVDACLDILPNAFAESTADPDTDNRKRDMLLDELVQRAVAERRDEIVIDAADVDVLFPARPRGAVACRSMDIGFSVAAPSSAAIDAGEFAIVASTVAGSPFAGAINARFFRILRTQTEHDLFADDGITAELVYAPRRARLHDVGVRSVPTAYEIAVGTFPGGTAQTIALDDLWVALDERTKRFVIRSKSLDTVIRVVETTALNPVVAAPPVARFLSLIARAEIIGPAQFSWTDQQTAYAYRPRLRYGRIVLKPATWQFDKDALISKGLTALSARALPPCPRFASLVLGDRRVLVDTTSTLGDAILRDALRKVTSPVVSLEETPLSFPSGWLRGRDGEYHAEFTVSARVQVTSPSPPIVAASDLLPAAARGSDDWLYLQFFDSAHRLDFVLCHSFEPLYVYAREHEIPWFFVRYNDPEPHVRLRFKVGDDAEHRRELTRIARAIERASGVRRIAEQRYEPEVERYGGHASVRACEKIFCVSSTLALRSLSASALPDNRIASGAGDLTALLFAVVPEQSRDAAIEELRPARETSRLDDAGRSALRQLRAQWQREDPGAIWGDLDAAAREGLASASRSMGSILSSVNHMHANRLGLHGSTEQRMNALLWHFAVGRMRER